MQSRIISEAVKAGRRPARDFWNFIYGIMYSQLNILYRKRYLGTNATVNKDLLVMETTWRKRRKVLLS